MITASEFVLVVACAWLMQCCGSATGGELTALRSTWLASNTSTLAAIHAYEAECSDAPAPVPPSCDDRYQALARLQAALARAREALEAARAAEVAGQPADLNPARLALAEVTVAELALAAGGAP